MALIGESHQAVWGSDFSIVKEEQDLTLKEDFGSFEMDKMTVQTDQLFWFKEATDMKNIHPREHEVDVYGKEKTLVHLLNQFHAHFYWLYEKGMTCAMVGLQGPHSGEALRHPNISSGVGLQSFCPWCFKLGGNMETITIHLWEVHYWMVIVCNICQMFAGMSTQNILDHQVRCKAKCNEEHAEHKGHEKAQKSHKKKKSKSQGQKGASESLGSETAKKSHWVEVCSMPSLSPTSQSNEQMFILSLNHSESLWIHLWVNPHSIRWIVLFFC